MASSTRRYRAGFWPAILVLAACASGIQDQAELPENPIAAGAHRVLDSTQDLQPACQVADVVDHIHQFIAALNAGDPEISQTFFTDGRKAEFKWLSFTDRDPGGGGEFTTFTPDGTPRAIDSRFAARRSSAGGPKMAR
jgi:hypothetical protein